MTEPSRTIPKAHVQDDLDGRRFGRYLIRSRLGSGGVATVYQAYDQVLGQTVALKLLPPNPDANTLQRFRREALMAGALRHPHIVRILQVGSSERDGSAYLAMDMIEGQSLALLLERHGHLQPEESCNLLEPIARALAHAHGHGIVHRDVKPANILLRPISPGMAHGIQLESLDHPIVPILSDFGVARFLDAPELTVSGRTVGTPAYMAPEQCAGSREVDARADIYSLGTVLYRCIVGRPPFAGTSTKILHSHVHDQVMIDDELLGRLSPIVVRILRRSLAKQPERRYDGTSEMAVDLAQAAGRASSTGTPLIEDREATATATLTLTSLSVEAPTANSGRQTVLIAGSEIAASDSGESRTAQLVEDARSSALGQGLPDHSFTGKTLRQRGLLISWNVVLVSLVTVLALVVIGGTMYERVSPAPAVTVIEPVPVVTLQATGATAEVTSDRPTVEDVSNSPVSATATSHIASVGNQPVPMPSLSEQMEPAPLSLDLATSQPPVIPTEAPEVSVQPTSVATPTSEKQADQAADTIVTTCATVVDEMFIGALEGLGEPDRNGFGCPNESAYTVAGELLPFERGFILHLDENPLFYVYYSSTGEWEQAVGQGREEEATLESGNDSLAPGLFAPGGTYGLLWADDQRRDALGYSLEAWPIPLQAIVQSYPGGILIGDHVDGTVHILLRSKLRF